MEVVVVVKAAAELNVIVPELEVKLIVAVDPVTIFPKLSSATTLTAPEATPAATDCVEEVMISLLAAAGVMVSVWVPLVNPVEAAVIRGEPVVVSLK